jgi:hypothetical protein
MSDSSLIICPAIDPAQITKKMIINHFSFERKEMSRRIVTLHGTEWRNDKGELHRENGPAVEWINGYKAWYQNGERHREDGPAIEWVDGSRAWYRNGERHKEWWANGRNTTWDQ